MDYAIDTRGLYKWFEGFKAIDGLDIAVPPGSIFGLIGPNGAGKTTLIQMLIGIIHPDRGDAFILGHSIREKNGSIRNQVGYVPDVPVMYPSFTVAEMYRLGSKLYPDWDQDHCFELHRAFGLPDNQRIRSLSRGQKVQVSLVMALALRPRLLLLDEPTAGLDPVVRRAFLRTVIDEAASRGTTIFYSTHNLNDLEQSADHIAAIYQGKLLFTRNLDELKQSMHRLQLVFGSPPGEGTIASLPGLLNWQGSGKVITITIKGDLDSIYPRLNALGAEMVKMMDFDLESMFVELMKAEGYGFGM